MSAPLSVSELTRSLKSSVALRFGDVVVEGEVCSFTLHRSGHWHFSIQDARAIISCVMFRGFSARLRWRPAVGDRVVIGGGLDIYPPHGKYNLIVRRMERAGAGALQQRREALTRRLQAEGLMAPSRKRPLPTMPRAIGVATSASGKAFDDIRTVTAQRFPGMTVFLAPCQVQGVGAAASIVAALALLNQHGGSDVIIVGRGGGSREDLAAFSAEAVARAVAASPVPVVSAVGHEGDESISDLVADVRAAPPSHAAELVVPERAALAARLNEQYRRLLWGMRRGLAQRREALDRLPVHHPRQRIDEARARCDALHEQLTRAAMRELAARRQLLRLLMARLQALSPLAVLCRGYSLTRKGDRAIRTATELVVGDRVEIQLAEGTVMAEIIAG